MDIIIEKAAPGDAAELLEHLKTIGSETDNLSFGPEGLPFSVEAEAEYLRQLEYSRNGVMLVAKADGRIVGNASMNRQPRRMSHRGEFSVSVSREYWNHGIGSLLTERILVFARENDFRRIDLQVRSDNASAIHLYEKYGFVKLCTYPGFFRISGKDIDFDFMTLCLEKKSCMIVHAGFFLYQMAYSSTAKYCSTAPRTTKMWNTECIHLCLLPRP